MEEWEARERRMVVNEALTWLGTPYHHQGRVKGAGTDCAMILCEVFHDVGLLPRIEPEYYPPDWHLHRSEERYLNEVVKYLQPCNYLIGQPGDIVLYRYGRCVSHAAIVVEWPTIIHAYLDVGVELADTMRPSLAQRIHSIWSVWGGSHGR